MLRPGDTIKDAGICSGDVLWLLSPRCLPDCQNSSEPAVGQISSTAEVDQMGAIDTREIPVEEDYFIEAPKYGRIPMHLYRVLCSNSGSCTSAPEMVFLTFHAAMLETGFMLSNQHHGSEERKKESFNDAHILPASVAEAIKRGTCSVRYTLSSQSPCKQQPTCTVVCSVMGHDVLVATNNDGHSSNYIRLDSITFFSTYTEMHQEESQVSLERMLCPHVGITPDKELSISRGSIKGTTEAICMLWTKLKNELILPALADVCRVAGLPPPVGLLTMATDIKVKILDYLDACDLAAVSATCTELHHLADNDNVWKRLCNAHFPTGCSNTSDYIKTKADKMGWKWVYGQCYKDRQRRMDEERNRQRRRPVAMIPSFGPAHPPFYPAPPHPGFPTGMIGGDQDRLPYLGGSGLAGRRSFRFPGSTSSTSSTRSGRNRHWF